MTTQPIKQWPSDCRPREKLLDIGAAGLSDAELLTLFIRTGTREQSALDLARAILRESGDLRTLIAMDWPRAKRVRGIGLARFCELQAAIELGRRCLSQSLKRGELLNNEAAASALIQSTLQDQKVEVFLSLSLDSQLRLISLDEIARGSLTEINFSPRLVVEKALARRATGVIVAHNHPSGSATPSESDIRFTQKLRQALESVDIRLYDHILVCDGAPQSFNRLGLLG